MLHNYKDAPNVGVQETERAPALMRGGQGPLVRDVWNIVTLFLEL